ncbi:hypothetical protein LR48_Vigan08g056200 [Vigna angularis]|uniref:Uncharacterized protein n=1 Tax=Phaseolus angularis TaxID=3914 RepID=A0A0L9V3S7_PHAAN|nr:hypothetical protein LR48_Vigan08g056200 [Vigna angularis]
MPTLVITRYELWKAARTKSDGNMTSFSAALISQRIFKRPQKQPIHDTVIHEDDDMAEAKDDPLSKLMTRLPRLKKAPLELYWDLRVFGLPPLVPVYITLPDALENELADSGGGTNQPSSPLTWTIEAPNNGRGASTMQRNGLKMTGGNRKVSGMKQWFGEGETEAQFQTVVFCELGSEMEAKIWVLKCDADGWRCASNGA